MKEVQTIKLDFVKSTKHSLIYSNLALGVSNFKVPKNLMGGSDPNRIGVTFEIANDAQSIERPIEGSIEDLRSKLTMQIQKNKELRSLINKLEKTCQHDWVGDEGASSRHCRLCGKKDKDRKIREDRKVNEVRKVNGSIKCECCSETKNLSTDSKVAGWWAISQKNNDGFSSRPLTTAGLNHGERAACGIGHLMILCERAASGSLDKIVYPDNNKLKLVGLTEVTVNSGGNSILTSTNAKSTDDFDDLLPDPTVPEPEEIPVFSNDKPTIKFHIIPFLVRIINKHLRPPNDEEFPFPSESTDMNEELG